MRTAASVATASGEGVQIHKRIAALRDEGRRRRLRVQLPIYCVGALFVVAGFGIQASPTSFGVFGLTCLIPGCWVLLLGVIPTDRAVRTATGIVWGFLLVSTTALTFSLANSVRALCAGDEMGCGRRGRALGELKIGLDVLSLAVHLATCAQLARLGLAGLPSRSTLVALWRLVAGKAFLALGGVYTLRLGMLLGVAEWTHGDDALRFVRGLPGMRARPVEPRFVLIATALLTAELLLLACLALWRPLRATVHAVLARRGEGVSAAAGIAELLDVQASGAILRIAAASFRAVRADRLERRHMDVAERPAAVATPRRSWLLELGGLARAAEVDPAGHGTPRLRFRRQASGPLATRVLPANGSEHGSERAGRTAKMRAASSFSLRRGLAPLSPPDSAANLYSPAHAGGGAHSKCQAPKPEAAAAATAAWTEGSRVRPLQLDSVTRAGASPHARSPSGPDSAAAAAPDSCTAAVPDSAASAVPDSYALSEPAILGEVDAFLSHSWHDDPDAKWLAFQAWRDEFKAAHGGREPTVWFDALCIDQNDISAQLPSLPVYLSGCHTLVALHGPTYLSRLWCVVELFVYFQMGADVSRIHYRTLAPPPGRSSGGGGASGTGEPAATARPELDAVGAELAGFDVRAATATSADDQSKLLAVIEGSGGGAAQFNEWLRATVRRALELERQRELPGLGRARRASFLSGAAGGGCSGAEGSGRSRPRYHSALLSINGGGAGGSGCGLSVCAGAGGGGTYRSRRHSAVSSVGGGAASDPCSLPEHSSTRRGWLRRHWGVGASSAQRAAQVEPESQVQAQPQLPAQQLRQLSSLLSNPSFSESGCLHMLPGSTSTTRQSLSRARSDAGGGPGEPLPVEALCDDVRIVDLASELDCDHDALG